MDLTSPEQQTPSKAHKAKWKWATRKHLAKLLLEGFLEEAKLFPKSAKNGFGCQWSKGETEQPIFVKWACS